MTADHDKTESPPPADVQVDVAPPAPMISRRMLLRGASAAVPTILTLNSGVAAAAAAASNMIAVGATRPETFEGSTSYICVNTGNPIVGSKMELGNSPVFYRIPDPATEGVEYRTLGSNWGSADAANARTPEQICYNGGQYEYSFGGSDKGQTQPLPAVGGIASAAALASFSSVREMPFF